jgi:Circularly permutated YpsA SLOG family
MMIEKIISGGQTGADLGGLKAAQKAGVKTGGIAPKGYKTENGSNPKLLTVYGLGAAPNEDYKYRTMANVRASHATIIFSTNSKSRGTKLTIQTCEDTGKSFVLINPFDNDAAKLVLEFIKNIYLRYERRIIMNIAGNRESKSPGIENCVESLLFKVLTELL